MSSGNAYFVGGGIASLAGACFLLQDDGFPAQNVHILEQDDAPGGSLDGSGSLDDGFLIRGGILRTKHNQYDSIVLPLTRWLESQGVQFEFDTTVTDVDFETTGDEKRVVALKLLRGGVPEAISIGTDDRVVVTLGSIPAASSVGSWDSAAVLKGKADAPDWLLWEKIAQQSSDFGNPSVFDGDVQRSKWQSCTITLRNPALFDFMEEFAGNVPGTGGLVTLVDSSWLMSFFMPYQPHFLGQPEDGWVFWAYGLFPDNTGDYVKKNMSECTGREILVELLRQLDLEQQMDGIMEDANAIPCIMPFADSEFMPRKPGDRPRVVPRGAKNFAFVDQFVEVPTVYTGLHDVHVLHEATKAMRR